MEPIHKIKTRILNAGQPAPFLSDNVALFIADKLSKENFNLIVEFGAGNSTRYFLSKLIESKKICTFVSVEYNIKWFKELVKCLKADLKSLPISDEKIELKVWSYEKCKKYILGENLSHLNIPPDLMRFPKSRRTFAGPFNIKMLIYRLIDKQRPLDGYYSLTIADSIKFMLLLRSEFFKDQYGESPIKDDYIMAGIKPITQFFPSAETLTAAFIIDGGPRWDLINTILDLEEKHSNLFATIFLCEANRSIYFKSLARRPEGKFIRGSNISLLGEPVYKRTHSGQKAIFTYGKNKIVPSELAEKEVWFYESFKGEK